MLSREDERRVSLENSVVVEGEENWGWISAIGEGPVLLEANRAGTRPPKRKDCHFWTCDGARDGRRKVVGALGLESLLIHLIEEN